MEQEKQMEEMENEQKIEPEAEQTAEPKEQPGADEAGAVTKEPEQTADETGNPGGTPKDGQKEAEQDNPGEEDSEQDDAEPEAADEEDPEQEAGAKADGSRSFFRKKKKDDKKDQRIAELEDRVKRQLAEFENFRNRTEKEKSHMYEVGARDIIEKILPVVDNFERGLAAVPEDAKEDPVAQGMDKIYKQLMTVLTDLGVKPIEAAGQPFDPNFHNAVMHVDDESLGENIVAEEFQKGYIYKETVIRHSMVKVAN